MGRYTGPKTRISRRYGVQAKCTDCASKASAPIQPACNDCHQTPKLDGARPALSQASQPLPHQERIQSAFGRHDLSSVRTLTGGTAREANDDLGAHAFTGGDRIAFRDQPDE